MIPADASAIDSRLSIAVSGISDVGGFFIKITIALTRKTVQKLLNTCDSLNLLRVGSII